MWILRVTFIWVSINKDVKKDLAFEWFSNLIDSQLNYKINFKRINLNGNLCQCDNSNW